MRAVWQLRVEPFFLAAACGLLLVGFLQTDAAGSRLVPRVDFRARAQTVDVPNDQAIGLASEALLVGWFGPSDPENEAGGTMWRAALWAVERANQAGGAHGRPFRLVPCWSDDPWAGGVAEMFRLTYEQPILACIGSVDGSATHLAEQMVVKARLPLVSPVSSDPSVNLAGVPWMFSVAPDDRRIAAMVAGLALEALAAPDDVLVVVSVTDHDSRSFARELTKALSVRNRIPDFQIELPHSFHDLRVPLGRLKSANPEVVIVVGGARESALIVRAIREEALSTAIIGGHSMGEQRFHKLAGSAAEGVRFPMLFDAKNPAPAGKDLVRHFEERHGCPPDFKAAFTADAVALVLDAIRHSDLSRDSVCQQLRELAPWPGISGRIQWDARGQNQGAVFSPATIREGHLISIR